MRTYYVIEMGAVTFPVNELRVQTSPPADLVTRQLCNRVRAGSAKEAGSKVRERLNEERFKACQEQLS